MGGFQNFVWKCFLPFPPPPQSSLFLALAPVFAQAKHRKSRFSVFLNSKAPRKRLLRRLIFIDSTVITAGELLTVTPERTYQARQGMKDRAC